MRNERGGGPVRTRDPRRWSRAATLALAHVLTTAFLAHHPEAGAQSAGSAVSPILPPDAAELVGAKPKRDHAHTAIGLRIVLPRAGAASKRGAGTVQGNQPLQIGFHRAIPVEYRGDLSALMEWAPLADGSLVSAVSVTSPGALAVRVGIRAELGPGGQVRFFGGGSSSKDGVQGRAPRVFPVMTRADFQEGGEPCPAFRSASRRSRTSTPRWKIPATRGRSSSVRTTSTFGAAAVPRQYSRTRWGSSSSSAAAPPSPARGPC